MFWGHLRSRRWRATVDNPGKLGLDGGSTEPPRSRAATGRYRHDPAESPNCSQCWEGQSSSAAAQRAETFDKKQRANNILAALVQRWENKANQSASANELASKFCRSLQECPDLIGERLTSNSIESMYPIFWRSLGYTQAPPYKDFAKALSEVMPKKRLETWRSGKRKGTLTVYLIPDPHGSPR
jgi:hypothetical protein